MSVKEELSNLLVQWLRESKNIVAEEAYFGSSTAESVAGGCDTCGYGSDPMSFEINYRTDEAGWMYVYVERDPLELLSELLAFEE